MFKNTKITTKIIGAMATLVLGMLIMSGTTYVGLTSVNSEIEEISEYQMPLNKVVAELEKDILREEILTNELIIASEDVHSKKFLDIEHHIIEIEKHTVKKIIECEVLTKKAIEHAHEVEIKSQYQSFLKTCEDLEHMQKEYQVNLKKFEDNLINGNVENMSQEKDILISELSAMDGNITKLVTSMTNLLSVSTSTAEKDGESALLTIEVISLIIVILSVIIGFGLVSSIRNGLTVLHNGVTNLLTSKDITSRVKVNSKDEIGAISVDFNKYLETIENGIDEDNNLIDEAKIVIGRVKKGCYADSIEKNTSNTSLNEFKNEVNDMIIATKQHFVNMNIVLEEYSIHNYMNKLQLENIEKGGVFDVLVNDINTLRDSITTMLVENKTNGLTLDKSSEVLLKNVNNLNTNSNEAAAALEETAAALEEMTSNIANSTNSVIKMASYGNEVKNLVNVGQTLAKETTTAMNEIDVEVNSISEAITVIDQIAFQTNILSLNAAVEAATAGEAGKGFAVVAQEVRNLASRSAEAANEIKTLVENATQKADKGKNISDKMIDGYTHLNESITKTLTMISNVEMASKEQNQGIEQINDAVALLDQQTQKNAMIASETHDVSVQTDTIAKLVVSNANEKEFVGKNDTIARTDEEIDFIERRNSSNDYKFTGVDRRGK
ncbi:methyl-accepting chemotaxis protein [Arcobacteraceae bacterium]|nr:methyl-accepting chemotaxis protein [Arcobacteraceae bacterium]